MSEDLAKVFLDESADDEGNAQSVHAAVGQRFLFCDAYGWMRYMGTHWETSGAEAHVERAIIAVLKQRRHAAVDAGKESIIKCSQPSAKHMRDCKTLLRSKVTADLAEFDASPDQLNVANGVLTLRTATLAAHSPEQRFTYCVRVPFDATVDCSAWESFLAGAIGSDPAVLRYLQMVVGYTLTGHTSEECLWYLYGPSRSGKGTFTEGLLALLPHPLAVEVDFASFTATREGDTQNFDLAPLRPARLIVASESNRYSSLNTAKIKALTGGNYIRCAFKHRDHFTYRPQFKCFLVSNEPLNADVDDDATWYRAKVIEFPNGHAGDEDKGLKARLKSPANLAAVLRWAVEGARAWYAAPNGLMHPKQVADLTRKQREELDYVGAWLEECCAPKPAAWESYERLYHSYQSWCQGNGVMPKTLRLLVRSLKAKGYVTNAARLVDGKTLKGAENLEILVVFNY